MPSRHGIDGRGAVLSIPATIPSLAHNNPARIFKTSNNIPVRENRHYDYAYDIATTGRVISTASR